MFFTNRVDAGRRLAAALGSYGTRSPVVLGLPRGGVPVAFEVAHALDAPLDILAVRKIGAPNEPELAVGAVAQEATARTAVSAVREMGARDIIVAAPVCSPEARQMLEDAADAVVCLETPQAFGAVGYWYADFTQTSDQEVRDLLRLARLERETHHHTSSLA